MAAYADVQVHPDGTVTGHLLTSRASVNKPFTTTLDLLWIKHAADADLHTAIAIWALQDHAGQPGTIPSQGWDFSYIERSSPEARQAMLDLARHTLTAKAFAQALGLTPSALLAAA